MPAHRDITKLVESIPLADTHEHLLEEDERLVPGDGDRVPDIGALFYIYSSSDLAVAGMPQEQVDTLFKQGVPLDEKWRLLRPYYELCRNTGYLQSVRISIETLYGEGLSDASVERVNDRFLENLKPGITRRVLKDIANIDHSQVNGNHSLPCRVTKHPDVLLQDISGIYLVNAWSRDDTRESAGVQGGAIDDYHRFIDSVFEQFSSQATAVKSQHNYFRRLDFADVPAEEAAPILKRALAGDPVSPEERKTLEDHLFNYMVRKAAEHGLPIKLHCGYYAGHNRMPIHRIRHNAGDMAELLVRHPDAKFVFMHINYPYQSELVAVCKQFTNAYADMCWAWGINPAASVRFLKEFLMAVPVNKVFTFGGDVTVVENVVGHAAIARAGIAQALSELVDDGWIRKHEVGYVANRVMRDNARELFRISEKFGR